jgi:multidrug efflux pump subunit AcrB
VLSATDFDKKAATYDQTTAALQSAKAALESALLNLEFAKQIEDQGKDTITAVTEACKLRLRPILMTSIAFLPPGAAVEIAVAEGFEQVIR